MNAILSGGTRDGEVISTDRDFVDFPELRDAAMGVVRYPDGEERIPNWDGIMEFAKISYRRTDRRTEEGLAIFELVTASS